MKALKKLLKEAYARGFAEARAEIEKATTTEAERWADRLNWLHTKHGADCSGTDSADLLDCVEDEIKQVINKQSELIEQMQAALKEILKIQRTVDLNLFDIEQVHSIAEAALSAAERPTNDQAISNHEFGKICTRVERRNTK